MASSGSPRLDGTSAPWPPGTCSGSWPSCTTANGQQRLQVCHSVKHFKITPLEAQQRTKGSRLQRSSPLCAAPRPITTLHFRLRRSKDTRAPVVHGATDLQDHHHQQVQEEAWAAHGLPKDVSSLSNTSSHEVRTFCNLAAVCGVTGLGL